MKGYAVKPGPSIVEKLWKMMDEATEAYDPKAEGLAEALALMMNPHYRTAHEIKVESQRRVDIQKKGHTPDTFGIEGLRTLFKEDLIKKGKAKA